MESRLAKVVPADLPDPPWVLVSSRPASSSNGLGGPFLRVLNNEAFLAALKRDVKEGPEGARGHVVMDDLRDLRIALDKEKKSAGNERQHAVLDVTA